MQVLNSRAGSRDRAVTSSLRRASGADAVYRALTERIVSGELAPGVRLYEPELAAALAVSRTPVREALRMLAAEGLVVPLPTGGHTVAAMDAEDVAQLYDVRSVLEGLAAREACRRLTDADGARLTELVRRMERMHDYEDEVLRLGKEFHSVIEGIAGNSRCTALIRMMRTHIDRYRALATHQRGRPIAAIQEHREVLAALLSGDPDAAEQAMRAHVTAGAEVAIRALP